MGRPRKKDAKEVLNVRLPPNLGRILKERAALLGKPPSAYLREIIENWEANGCPPVSFSDESVVMRMSEDALSGSKSNLRLISQEGKQSSKPAVYEDKNGDIHLPGGIVARRNPEGRKEDAGDARQRRNQEAK